MKWEKWAGEMWRVEKECGSTKSKGVKIWQSFDLEATERGFVM